MMKKLLLLLVPAALLALSACQPSGGNNSNGGGDTPIIDPDRKKDLTVNFFLDYSHSEEPFFVYEWYTLIPMGECPEEAKLTSADASDPLFPVFVCWSEYSSSIDDSHAWNFKTDSKTGKILNLYGIWTSAE